MVVFACQCYANKYFQQIFNDLTLKQSVPGPYSAAFYILTLPPSGGADSLNGRGMEYAAHFVTG